MRGRCFRALILHDLWDSAAIEEAYMIEIATQRRKAAWPLELNQAVETALASEEQQPPLGVTPVDWERVLQVRQLEAYREQAKNGAKLDEQWPQHVRVKDMLHGICPRPRFLAILVSPAYRAE
jgi:hypothetical protein